MQLNYKKGDKPFSKKGCGIGCLTWIVLFIIIGIIASSNDNDESSTDTLTEITTESTANQTTASENHIYDTAEIRDIMNGSGTEKIGEYSIIEADSSDITDEILNDWYFNYVKSNNYNYCLIIYTNAPNTGVYASESMMIKDAGINNDFNCDYVYTSSENETVYYISDDCTSLKDANTSTTEPLSESSTDTSELTAESATTENEIMVWISSSGSKYHRKSTCSNMQNPTEISLKDAESRGYTPCKRCY